MVSPARRCFRNITVELTRIFDLLWSIRTHSAVFFCKSDLTGDSVMFVGVVVQAFSKSKVSRIRYLVVSATSQLQPYDYAIVLAYMLSTRPTTDDTVSCALVLRDCRRQHKYSTSKRCEYFVRRGQYCQDVIQRQI